MNKLDLSNTTLFCLSSININETLLSIKICESFANFNRTVFLQNDDIKSTYDYSQFIINKLPYIIDTEFVLIIQWDGFIINPNAWTSEFFEYDYIGAPWPSFNYLCGNGGFSLRSKKFLEIQKIIAPQIDYNKLSLIVDQSMPEDAILCLYYRKYFEQRECKFAPFDVGRRFSIELGEYDKNNLPFGFHGRHHFEDFFSLPPISKIINKQ